MIYFYKRSTDFFHLNELEKYIPNELCVLQIIEILLIFLNPFAASCGVCGKWKQ